MKEEKMEPKLTIDCPEYRRAVELLAAMISTLSVDEKKEFCKALKASYSCGEESCCESWDEYLENTGNALFDAINKNLARGNEMDDASKFVAVRIVHEALEWIRGLFQGYAHYATDGLIVSRADFVEEILADVERIKLAQEKKRTQDGKP